MSVDPDDPYNENPYELPVDATAADTLLAIFGYYRVDSEDDNAVE